MNVVDAMEFFAGKDQRYKNQQRISGFDE